MTTTEISATGGSAHVNGQLVPISEAKISLLDWGFLHSDATYDVAHVWQGSFFRLDDHIERFHAGMEKLHLSIPYNRNQLRKILSDCVALTGLQNAYVEMICTRGIPEPGSRDPRSCSNQFFAFAIPFVWIADLHNGNPGIHLIVSQQQRIPAASIDPTIKNYHWLDMVSGLFEAYARGGEAAILVDADGNLVEGPGFNIFTIKNKCLVTPSSGVLEGITRRTVIELAEEHGFTVRCGELSLDEAYEADEIFITSTAGGVMPVYKLDECLIAKGQPGAITSKLQKEYWALHDLPIYSYDVDYQNLTHC